MSKINWAEIMEANRDSIIEKMVQAKKESEGTMSGWSVDVEIDEKGEVWTTGLMSQGSQSMSSWNGETFIVASVKSWTVEIDESECIKSEPSLLAEFEAQKDDELGYEYEWEFMQAKYPEIVKEWQDQATEFEVESYAEEADAILDRRIEEERLYNQG